MWLDFTYPHMKCRCSSCMMIEPPETEFKETLVGQKSVLIPCFFCFFTYGKTTGTRELLKAVCFHGMRHVICLFYQNFPNE
ncbi:hypothetical protein BIV59_04745 [Bacillus sp. MUM 13]|nr:hypothetical protein BIV59_04745 [Bacillus sp. MUM 13]